MSQQITTAFVQQFGDQIVLLAQQKGSRLRDRVMEKVVTGTSAFIDRIGSVAAVRVTSRHQPTPQMDTPHSRRRVDLDSWVWNDFLDKEDEIRLLIDPTSSYALQGGFALGRTMDDTIIAAATGNSISVSSSLNATTSNVSLTGGLFNDNIISSDFHSANSNLTVDKLIEARRLLAHHNVDMDEELTLVLNASAQHALLSTTQATSVDFNSVRALVSGQIDTFLGFKFIQLERLQGVLSTSDSGSPVAGSVAGPIMCFAFAKSGLALAMGRDIEVRITERPDMRYLTQVYASLTQGAVRVEEEKVIQINCYQTA